jgi:pentatricopeptide repeat protein
MYFQEGEVADAELVFAESHGSSRTVVSWTAMVAGYVQNYFFGEAVALFGTIRAPPIILISSLNMYSLVLNLH